jgi:hypothetical protein
MELGTVALKARTSGGGFLSIERVVAALTPVFAAGAGWVTSVVGNNIPGVHIPSGWVAALFSTGAAAAAAAALKWLHGRQKFVNFTTDSEHVIQEVVSRLQAFGGAPLMDIEKVLAAHESNIINAVGSKIGLSPSAEEIAKKIVQELWPHGAAAGAGAAQAT